MKVSATEIAVAATEFWRQGLDEQQVNERLIATTQYAKISAMEFEDAAEVITAATNTMGISAQHVADIFAYLGDMSASGPDEIGRAMQKASASAKEFGLTFEWLGAYIATMSEATRQAPEVIGTSINSIMARLHSIKQKGFNEEDTTKINDIAKALGTIDVALMDNEGNWRNMSDIFSDIAAKWDTLSGKQKSYISTTMAGTRQQNYFIALMSDMAKGVEGGSRAYELYAGAMGAAGTAAQKYAVWQESVTAAQNRLTAAMESFYSLLDAEWMKKFYEGMAGFVEIITAGTDALGGWNLIIPIVTAGVIGLIAVVYKAVTAIKAMHAALAAGEGIASVASGGVVGAIIAIVGLLATVATMIIGSIAKSNQVEKVDYTSTIQSIASYRDNVETLVTELETLAAKTDLTAEEQARADEIMQTLSGTSLSMKKALENGGEGFDTLAEKAAAARGELEKTDQILRSLNAADALQNLRDADNSYADAVRKAQQELHSSSQYDDIAAQYAQYMTEHPTGLHRVTYPGAMGTAASKDENFYTYADRMSRTGVSIFASREAKAQAKESMAFWSDVVQELNRLGIDAGSSVEEIGNKMLEFDIAAASFADANQQALADTWQPIFDDLYTVMTDGTQFSQLPQFMQQAATEYYNAYIGAIDQQAELAEGDLMAMAADLSGYVTNMVDFVDANADFSDLIHRFDELSSQPLTIESANELNSLIPIINEFISAYNAMTETTDDDFPLLGEILIDDLVTVKENIEEINEAVAALDTASIYKDLAVAKEEANGFVSVLAKLGEGEDQFDNLHEAVVATAQEIADAYGITDVTAISKIAEKLLEGLYETYPEIINYVDTATGLLTEGWEEGVAKATNPWASFFKKEKLDDALKEARRDMDALDASSLWDELLSPEGKGLYEYADDWARSLIPDGTEEEVHELAQQFVDAFFEMFDGIDTSIMDGNGRIASGMDETIATMRKAANAANAEATKLENAYKSLHADTIARNEAISGLTNMKGLVEAGNLGAAKNNFEALSSEAISAISSAMPEFIDKMNDGTVATEDFEAAIVRLHEAEVKVGKDAWKDYFGKTSAGLKQQSSQWASTMKGIIAEVSAADDRETAFYNKLIALSKEGVDISGMLDQYGSLALLLLSGTENAERLYAILSQMENLSGLQVDLEEADKLAKAVKSIDPSNVSYNPLNALSAYDTLEQEYSELTDLQRGSVEYLERARQLTQETVAEVYNEAAAYGVVTELQAKAAQAAASGERDRTFRRVDENNYAGGVAYLENAVQQAQDAGEDVTKAWEDALSNLDEAGHLEAMCEMFGDISALAVECGGNVEEIIARLYEMREAAQAITLSDMAESLREDRESNFAGTNSYQDQIDALVSAFDSGGIESAMDTWNSFDASLQQSIAKTYPSLVIALDDANKAAGDLSGTFSDLEGDQDNLSDSARAAAKKVTALGKELGSAQKSANARYFKSTASAIEDLKNGAISVSDAFGAYNKEAAKAVKANEEYSAASKKIAAGTTVATSEIENLASYLGNLDPAALLQNWDQVGPMISGALAEGEAAFDRLNEAAFIVITGTSVADFSALTNGLISVQNLAAETVQALIATGQWTTETITMPQEGAQWDPISGTWTRTMLNTNQTVLKYAGSNPLKSGGGGSKKSSGGGGSGGRGGGGGGGSSSLSVSKSIQKGLDKMQEQTETDDHRRKMAQLAQQYHEVRGELQGVITYMEVEKKIVRENSDTLQGYLKMLEDEIAKQEAIIAKNKSSSKKYKQAMVDLEALQERHKEYSEQLLQNRIDLEKLDQAIQEQRDTIRDMEIDLRKLIHDAIEDREALNRRMLEGTIDIENEIIDILTKRYEKERDELLELAEAKREALNEELSLLDEQLNARKKLNEEEDRAKKLAELEAQLARISADPTRKKEELELREEIAELREEIAWDLAEQEVEAQKKSIESQIESIDDYVEYVESYYEEMLSNPRKLIEEMQELLNRTDEEIMAWLIENHEEYEKSTDATRESMRNGWQEMLDDMRGHTRTYWDEVESIIEQGDDAIIAFLKQHSADYKEAGELQAQAYVDEWKKKLEDLAKAHKQISATIKATDYTPTSSSTKSSGSSKSSSSSGSKKTTTTTAAKKTYYKATVPYVGPGYGSQDLKGYTTEAAALKAAQEWVNKACRALGGSASSMIGQWAAELKKKIVVKAYARGGMSSDTGLAWLDGTKARPERILSPYQTELFEDMLRSLHEIRMMRVPSSTVIPQVPEAQQPSYTIENITVQVQKLETDTDYEEIAEKVGEQIMEKAMRGMSVGGLRIG